MHRWGVQKDSSSKSKRYSPDERRQEAANLRGAVGSDDSTAGSWVQTQDGRVRQEKLRRSGKVRTVWNFYWVAKWSAQVDSWEDRGWARQENIQGPDLHRYHYFDVGASHCLRQLWLPPYPRICWAILKSPGRENWDSKRDGERVNSKKLNVFKQS